MRFFLLLFIFLPTVLFCQSFADSVSSYLFEYQELSEKHSINVWGYKFDSPVIFFDTKNKVVYANESLNQEGENTYKNVFITKINSQMVVTRPILEYNSKSWIVVDLPIKYSRNELMEFIAHETFHLIQDNLEIPTSNPSLPHLSTIMGRSLLHVEITELFKALKQSQTQERSIHIKNALTLRAYRYSQFPDAEALESICEMNEGLAEFTGRVYAGYTDEQLVEEYERNINLLESISNEAAYPYISGSLYAFLNELSGREWKNQLPEKSVSEITSSFYEIAVNENYEETADSLLNIDEYKEIPSNLSSISLEGLELMFSENIFIISVAGSRFQFKSNIVVSLPDKGTVYNNVLITNEWGKLEVDIDGRVMISDNITLSSESLSYEENQIKGKHWMLTLEPQWKVKEIDGSYVLQKK